MKDILNKIKLFDVIRAVLLVFFLGILLYPTVSDYLGRIHSSQAVSSYNNEVKGIDEATKKQMLEEAQEYNQSLVNTTKLYDPFSTTGKPSKEYMNLLNVSKDGMMAYLQIPKIDVKLPIYHSTNNGVLQKGVGHMEGSSLQLFDRRNDLRAWAADFKRLGRAGPRQRRGGHGDGHLARLSERRSDGPQLVRRHCENRRRWHDRPNHGFC